MVRPATAQKERGGRSLSLRREATEKEEAMRRRLAVVVAMVMMLAMTVPASAAPGNNGQGAAHAAPQASFGIQTAVVNSGSDECGIGCGE